MSDIAERLSTVATVVTGAQRTAYTLDSYTPDVVVQPSTADEVRAVLQFCSEYRVAGVVWGGGTHIGVGNPVQSYRWAMDMRALSRVVDYSPADLVVTVEAGMTLHALQNLLRPQQQWLPIDAPLPDRQTVGGIVATNGAGPRRHRYGLPREWLLAIRAALPSGEVVKAGVGVVKNVAGYDLPRLFAGSWGTLGVLTELTFKVAPLPESRRIYRSALSDVQNLYVLRDALSHPLLQPEMLEVVYRREGGWRVLCGLAGFEEDVRWQSEFLHERTRTEWEQVPLEEVDWLRDRYLLAEASCRCRCVVPPAQSVEMIRWLSQHFAEADLQAHFGAGVVCVWWSERLPEVQHLQVLREQAQRLGGFCILEHAPVEVKRALGAWGRARGGAEVMRRLKQEFDPLGILAPGRFVEEL
ncbi:MAG: FAD-binding oxidoreductase [Armatimonadota bacterium]|nr:FAD-binding oxidoreductase [bacterium]MDW8319809.1 FAD-binding oxidoreductase [Armatimonadota bacterium]